MSTTLNLIVFEREEREWLQDGIVEPVAYPVRQPYPSRRPGLRNVNVYWQDSALVADTETGWNCVLETQIPELDLGEAGIRPPSDGRSKVDLVALSVYLNRRAGDKTGCVLDAWREIAREDDAWCATVV